MVLHNMSPPIPNKVLAEGKMTAHGTDLRGEVENILQGLEGFKSAKSVPRNWYITRSEPVRDKRYYHNREYRV
jgi:hypothetical protein